MYRQVVVILRNGLPKNTESLFLLRVNYSFGVNKCNNCIIFDKLSLISPLYDQQNQNCDGKPVVHNLFTLFFFKHVKVF